MNKNTVYKVLSVLIAVFWLSGVVSCSKCRRQADEMQNGNVNNAEQQGEDPDSATKESVKKILYSTPLPIDMKDLFKVEGIYYEPSYMNPVDNVIKYEKNKKKAMNLGVYGLDLAYAQVFEQSNDYYRYMQVILEISDDLGVPGEFAKKVLDRLNANMNNKDSIYYIAQQTYKDASKYFKENDRESMSTLIFLGGWVEGMYIATQMYDEDKPNEALIRLIGTQKYIIGEMYILMKNTLAKSEDASDPLLVSLRSDLEELIKLYQEVEISWKKGEVAYDANEKALISTSDAIVKIDKEQVLAIKKKIKSIRNKMVS